MYLGVQLSVGGIGCFSSHADRELCVVANGGEGSATA